LASGVSTQKRFYAKTVQEQIAEQTKASKVVIYMKGTPNAPQCGFSRQVVDVLKRSGAEFTAFNVLESEAVRNGIKEFTSWPTIPQVFINGEFVGGCDIVTEMYRDGSLETALQEAGAIKKKAAPAS
jgi:monothiol glutaredoxin